MINNNQAVIGFNHYLTAFMLFSVIPAFYVWHSVFYSFFIVLAAVVTVIDIIQKGVNKKQVYAGVFFSFILLIYIIRAGTNIFGSIEIICVIPFFFVKEVFIKRVFDAFIRIFAVTMALSIPVYILVCWVGVSLPNWDMAPYNKMKILNYYIYPFLVTTDSFLGGLSPRFYGLFDEPGVMGTISAILLLSENFNLKKWENIVILLSGIFSFSFFFFIVCALYILISAPMKYRIVTAVVTIILVAFLYDNEILYNIFFHRFNVEDGVVEGMNREHGDFNSFYERFRGTSDYWFGLGKGVGAIVNEGGSSYKQLVVDYGIIFFVSYILSFYIYTFKAIKGIRNYLIFSIIFLGTMYQRPFVGTATFTFLMVASIIVISGNHLTDSKNGRKIGFSNSNFVQFGKNNNRDSGEY